MGLDGGVLPDTDAGPQFTVLEIPGLPDPPPNFFDVWGTENNDVYLVGERGTVVHWDGKSWSLQQTPTTADLHGVWGFAKPDAGTELYAVGNGGVVVHGDNGVWTTEASTATGDLHAVKGYGDNHGGRVLAVGVDGVIATKNLMMPGARWVKETSPSLETLAGLWVGGDGQAVAVGALGTILRRDTAGAWTRQRIDGFTLPLEGVWGTAPDQLWLVGLGGSVLKSNGMAFDEVMGAPSVFLRRVVGFDFGEVFITGWGGVIVRGSGTTATGYQNFSDHRLEGIWATHLDPTPIDPLNPDAGTWRPPRYYVVGVTGAVLIGP
ncbi:MAG: hypothetical protein U1E65_29700 [Myxococcota bacterium]